VAPLHLIGYWCGIGHALLLKDGQFRFGSSRRRSLASLEPRLRRGGRRYT
jgi:hypothetical protein